MEVEVEMIVLVLMEIWEIKIDAVSLFQGATKVDTVEATIQEEDITVLELDITVLVVILEAMEDMEALTTMKAATSGEANQEAAKQLVFQLQDVLPNLFNHLNLFSHHSRYSNNQIQRLEIWEEHQICLLIIEVLDLDIIRNQLGPDTISYKVVLDTINKVVLDTVNSKMLALVTIGSWEVKLQDTAKAVVQDIMLIKKDRAITDRALEAEITCKCV